MINRRVIILLLLMAFYVFYVRPSAEESQRLHEQNALIRIKIGEEINIAKNLQQSPQKKSQFIEKIRRNRSLVFAADLNESSAFGKLQYLVKQAALTAGVDLTQVNWGEPLRDEQLEIIRLPLSLTIQGDAGRVDKFFQLLLTSESLIVIKTANIQRKLPSTLTLRIALVGFKYATFSKNVNLDPLLSGLKPDLTIPPKDETQ